MNKLNQFIKQIDADLGDWKNEIERLVDQKASDEQFSTKDTISMIKTTNQLARR